MERPLLALPFVDFRNLRTKKHSHANFPVWATPASPSNRGTKIAPKNESSRRRENLKLFHRGVIFDYVCTNVSAHVRDEFRYFHFAMSALFSALALLLPSSPPLPRASRFKKRKCFPFGLPSSRLDTFWIGEVSAT